MEQRCGSKSSLSIWQRPYRQKRVWKTPHGAVVFLMHVDDMLFTGRPLALDDVLSALSDKYTLHVDRIHEEGDELTFLKRAHRLEGGKLGIQAHPKHIERLEQMHVRPRKTPVPVGALPTDVVADSLSEEEAHVFRSAVGVMLYLTHGICEAQYGIRLLAQHTNGAQKLLIHMASYLKGRTMALEIPVIGQGFKKGNIFRLGLDWNNLTVTSSSRARKAIALSTAESEFNAAISTACDLLYLRSCMNFLVGEAEVCARLLGDSSACRGVIARQGAGRIKRLSGKLLWIQNKNQTGEIVCCAVGTVLFAHLSVQFTFACGFTELYNSFSCDCVVLPLQPVQTLLKGRSMMRVSLRCVRSRPNMTQLTHRSTPMTRRRCAGEKRRRQVRNCLLGEKLRARQFRLHLG